MKDFFSDHKWGIVVSFIVVLMVGYFFHLRDYYDDERRIAEFHNNYPRMSLSSEYMLFEILPDKLWYKVKYAYRYFHWRSSLDAIALLEQKFNKTAEDYVVLAEKFMLVEQYSNSIDAYSAAINMISDNRTKAKILADRSKVRIINQKPIQDALQDIDEALLLDSQDMGLHELRAHYLRRIGKDVESLKELEYIIKYDPANNRIIEMKKDLEETMRNHEKLMQYLREKKKGS